MKKGKSKGRVLVILTIVVFIALSSFAISRLTITSPVSGSCGDGVCNLGESFESCPNDCLCQDSTFDEFVGDWGECSGGYRKRIIQNICAETKVETESCAAASTSSQEYLVEKEKFASQIINLNRDLTAAVNAYNDGVISAAHFKDRIDNIDHKSLELYYHIKRLTVPSQSSENYMTLTKASVAQLTAINSILEYFTSSDVEYLYDSRNWLEQSDAYANQV